MHNNKNGYQLGNYVVDWKKNIGEIIKMDMEEVVLKCKVNTSNFVKWNDFSPIPITVDIMKALGFSIVEQKENPYHRKYSMAIMLNGRFYNAIGIVYEDKSIWSFNSITLLYIHQVQNIISIISPSTSFNILDLL